MTVSSYALAPRERQILAGLADGDTLVEVAARLQISYGTAQTYRRHAKAKLHGVSESTAALAVAYANEAIAAPEQLDPEAIVVPPEQRDLIALLARGFTPSQMATELRRPISVVRADGRSLLVTLRAKNNCQAIKRAWQYGLLTRDEVMAWLP
ncbi:helix-turn-helix transcriptional regulator [Streptomyces sp. NPDC004732]|uniref:helix-turn-helix domain-containing protein n=1 Tax=Streptomyces sp. NPDC004732 TaxID=3154290 RepID=UPI0033BDE5B5